MKIRLIVTVMLTLVLGSMLIASVAACPVEAHGCKPLRRMPLNCRLCIELNWEVFTNPTVPSWIGKVWGDIKGDLYVYLVESSIEGDTEYFSEEWRIETKAGVIEGVDEGVWSLTTLKWVAEGEVTAATGKWNYLVGYNMRYGGKVTPNPFEVEPGTKTIGRGTLTIWRAPEHVTGRLDYCPHLITWKMADGNVFLKTWEEGNWSGGIEGISHDEPCRVLIHGADAFPPTTFDFRCFMGISTLAECTVDDKTGGLVILLIGKANFGENWHGVWVILRGTGELRGIHGQGTWWGPGAGGLDQWGYVDYEGWIRF